MTVYVSISSIPFFCGKGAGKKDLKNGKGKKGPSRRKRKRARWTPSRYVCNECKKHFASYQSLWRHKNAIHKGYRYRCGYCDTNMRYYDGIKRHIMTRHKTPDGSHLPIKTQRYTENGGSGGNEPSRQIEVINLDPEVVDLEQEGRVEGAPANEDLSDDDHSVAGTLLRDEDEDGEDEDDAERIQYRLPGPPYQLSGKMLRAWQDKEEQEQKKMLKKRKHLIRVARKSVAKAKRFLAKTGQTQETRLSKPRAKTSSPVIFKNTRSHGNNLQFQCQHCGKCFKSRAVFKLHQLELDTFPGKKAKSQVWPVMNPTPSSSSTAYSPSPAADPANLENPEEDEARLEREYNVLMGYESDSYQCSDITGISSLGSSLIRSITKKFACLECSDRFLTQELLTLHNGLFHGSGNHPCILCGEFFRDQQLFENHVEINHKEIMIQLILQMS